MQAEEELEEARAQAELYLDLMGHDINNLNQVGMGFLEVALEMLKEGGRIEGKDVELLEKPLRAIQDSTRLIDNVRKLQSAKSMEYQLQPVDLSEVLAGVKEQFSNVNGRHVTVNYTPTESHVLATGLVKDVFVNLVGNAVKHSDANKPLEISISQTKVYGTDESYHKVYIDDNGPGIPDELKTRIFNRFERGNTKAKGKGLGLFLVKTLVQDFYGKIWVEDRVKGDYTKGARFVVMLPAVEK
jgi:signal transduction histidine kinase